MCMLYESLLLFGVLAAVVLLVLVSNQNAAQKVINLRMQIAAFFAFGAYFSYFWVRGNGQTLAMQTWHIRLVSADGNAVRWPQACLRYIYSWMWFLPAMLISHALDLKRWPMVGLLGLGMLAWALAVFLDPQRQFLHDRLARTRLILLPPYGKDHSQ